MINEKNLIQSLLDGSVGVMPTDTIYGVVARASDKMAVERLYKLKRRENKPGTIIAASFQQLVDLGIDKELLLKVSQFWPGPISIIVNAPVSLAYLHQDTGSLALRVVDDEWVRGVLEQTGPLLTSSANQPGEPSSTTIEMAKNYFGDQVDFYLDRGDLSDRQASTIIKLDGDKITVLRQGAVKIS